MKEHKQNISIPKVNWMVWHINFVLMRTLAVSSLDREIDLIYRIYWHNLLASYLEISGDNFIAIIGCLDMQCVMASIIICLVKNFFQQEDFLS